MLVKLQPHERVSAGDLYRYRTGDGQLSVLEQASRMLGLVGRKVEDAGVPTLEVFRVLEHGVAPAPKVARIRLRSVKVDK